METPPPVVIVGAGLAGLACALELKQRNIAALIVEASDRVGGRVATDKVDGYLLDRGFQVLLTAYPECQKLLDYQKLQLGNFTPGALVFKEDHLHTVADPTRVPLEFFTTLASTIGTALDKMKIWLLKEDLLEKPLDRIFAQKEVQTIDELKKLGFTREFIESFFRPFLGGIFLENKLTTSNKMFEFVFNMFSKGHAALPAGGMQAIPEQLATKLGTSSIRLKTRVTKINDGVVELESGEKLQASAIVVATEGTDASKLINDLPTIETRSITCLYYEASKAPIKQPMLILNGQGTGIVNNVCVPTNVCASYGNGKGHLVSVSVLGNPFEADETANDTVKSELKTWFGSDVDGWKLLKVYRVLNALPDQTPPKIENPERSVKLQSNLFICGDHRDNASINGALVSGRRAAQAVADSINHARKI
jgi:protoporphyrinogen oxidase